jgi:ferrous iron transport protein A
MRFWGQSTGNRAGANNSLNGNDLCLSDARVGKSYTMLGLAGGSRFQEKIYSMGLNPGVKFKILLNSGHGPIELEVRQTKLAIGRGMARRIRIKENDTP